jgi:hypothetical protein
MKSLLSPPLLKGDIGDSVALFGSKLSNSSTGVLKERHFHDTSTKGICRRDPAIGGMAVLSELGQGQALSLQILIPQY